MVKRNTIKSSENEETLNGIFFFFNIIAFIRRLLIKSYVK